ncbi:MAG TPA: class I SAM-dependent methyltransferase [Dyella sp.]|uniref:class I SAM-dependent methyltransferase n=1 Tax=Dyella sp. TaxID=1869338 RepID=UPI002CDF2E71|nr:class I SAM-dependent methyltransferase [Dyella sp.]HTV85367.1 class I SAM-dependent methyltransferase [Dyella sp.]
MATGLEKILGELEQDRLLCVPDQLRRRAEALDRLETGLIHAPDPAGNDAVALHARAEAFADALEAVNSAFYQSLREDIRQGRGAEALSACLRELPSDHVRGEGYDYLDEMVSGVLQFDEPRAHGGAPGAEMVRYQPTPARHIFDFIQRAQLGERDVLIDMGAGLGHVSLLSAICTSARCVGVEVERAYIDCARHAARALNLRRVRFVHADARSIDLSSGTVFYLFTPFTGSILRQVLGMLEREAVTRAIRVCTLGPCTAVVAALPWLRADNAVRMDGVAVFRSY